MKELPHDTWSLEAELLGEENRQDAIAILQRLRAFVSRWRDTRENHETPEIALARAKDLLHVIGAKMTVIRGANSGSARERIARYLLTLQSPLGWQNTVILETNESLYAKLGLRLDMLEEIVRSYPIEPRLEKYEDFLDTADVMLQARGILYHAFQMRIAISTRKNGTCLVPVALTPIASRALSAVMANRTIEDWNNADSHESFWTCRSEEYQKAGDIRQSLGSFSSMIGKSSAQTLGDILDWNVGVQIRDDEEKGRVYLISRGHEIRVTIPGWIDNEVMGRGTYDDLSVSISDYQMPASTIPAMAGKALDDIVAHWMTKGSGAMIEGIAEEKLFTSNALVMKLRPGSGPVLYLESDRAKSRHIALLCAPANLRVIEPRVSS